MKVKLLPAENRVTSQGSETCDGRTSTGTGFPRGTFALGRQYRCSNVALTPMSNGLSLKTFEKQLFFGILGARLFTMQGVLINTDVLFPVSKSQGKPTEAGGEYSSVKRFHL